VAKLPWLLVVRVATLIALVASAALLSDYTADAPSFCSAASGCGAVRASQYSHVPIGDGRFLPLPLFGLVGFVLSYAASLLSRRAVQLTAIVGGLVAVWLLYVQAFVLQHFCWLCVTTDVSAVVAALAAGVSFKVEGAGARRLADWAWWALGALAVAAPLLWPRVKVAPPVPGGVASRYVAGKINVVEFADFQCPACRRYHHVLKPILQRYGDRVHFVRLHKPLPSHTYAEDAARAAVCAEQQGKLEPMADQLFSADDLSPQGIDRLAQSIGLDQKAFESCVLDPATNARVQRESGLLVPPELEGLPTTYIGGKRLLGVQKPEAVEDALERAARGEGSSGIAWYVYLPLVALCCLLVLRAGRARASV
jgi:protein-disulfide isomerase